MHVTGQFHLLASLTDPKKKKSYRPFALLTTLNPINNASQTAKHLLITPKEILSGKLIGSFLVFQPAP